MSWYGIIKTGVPEVDLDHTNIDNYLNYALHNHFDAELMAKLVSALITHFEREEKICQEQSLNFTQEHKQEHQRLTDHLNSLVFEETAKEELLFFFKQTLQRHIEDFDQHINPS